MARSAYAGHAIATFIWSHFPSRQTISFGLKMLLFMVAFSESPNDFVWLENAPFYGRIFRVAKRFRLA
jgi:hypothetical protein